MGDFYHLSDVELVDLLKSGNCAAYTEIYDRYVFVLLNHAYNKTRDREEAKDVVQEVFENPLDQNAKTWNSAQIFRATYTRQSVTIFLTRSSTKKFSRNTCYPFRNL